MTEYQIVWALYALGGLGAGWAAWFMFRRFGREWGLFFMVTVWVVFLTPFIQDQETMELAPAIFIYVMEGMTNGFEQVKHIPLVVGGVWVVVLILLVLYLWLTSSLSRSASSDKSAKKRSATKVNVANNLSEEESAARSELLSGETPIRAER
jgi:Na+-transporting methylmalonyl-CoA/oxaloacetate decarboxylase gamma subunit